MTLQSNRSEINHEIRATLAARQELGSDYDEQFLDALAEKLARQAPVQQVRPPRLPQRTNSLDASQRLTLAICSLIFGIPLVAISAALGGVVGLIFVCFAILGINFAAAR